MISSGIGPFTQGGLNEAFGLAIGPGRIGFGSDVFEAGLFASGGEGVRGIARPIIGHDSFDGDAEASVIGERGFQVGDGAVLFLVGEQVGIGDARGVIDAYMQVLPAHAAGVGLAGSIARDAVPGADKPPELLDVEMNHVARVIVYITPRGFSRFEVFESRQAGSFQHPADGGGGHAERLGDMPAGQPLTPQGDISA